MKKLTDSFFIFKIPKKSIFTINNDDDDSIENNWY